MVVYGTCVELLSSTVQAAAVSHIPALIGCWKGCGQALSAKAIAAGLSFLLRYKDIATTKPPNQLETTTSLEIPDPIKQMLKPAIWAEAGDQSEASTGICEAYRLTC